MVHRLSPAAEAELDEIWWYIAEQSGSVEAAKSVVASITERFSLLATFPHLGRIRNDLRPGMRGFTVGDYVILYSIKGEDVLILHVITVDAISQRCSPPRFGPVVATLSQLAVVIAGRGGVDERGVADPRQ